MTHAPSETAVSVSISRLDDTVSVDLTCGSAWLADALECQLRGMVSHGDVKLDLAREPSTIDGEIVPEGSIR
ncbi:hypothetical protein CCR97_04245 [Rhodoplanes elegans]|uniref:Uncharacterized protein n=1 Tax=Rhodoplanes elegans TaxID=29408 RepID=A0A327KJ08_9BRAD|nr:hypothetical protein [Rhodoplanes elegans]MBK5957420.1 hypothetical protein [Rhodoplanes elegans]RAI37475.1 hypothetical protein CH338_15975 [Rhodoplanes elegans]